MIIKTFVKQELKCCLSNQIPFQVIWNQTKRAFYEHGSHFKKNNRETALWDAEEADTEVKEGLRNSRVTNCLRLPTITVKEKQTGVEEGEEGEKGGRGDSWLWP